LAEIIGYNIFPWIFQSAVIFTYYKGCADESFLVNIFLAIESVSLITRVCYSYGGTL